MSLKFVFIAKAHNACELLNQHPAVFRLEDIHSRVPPDLVRSAAEIAHENAIPMHIALIPIFADPYGTYATPIATPIAMNTEPDFVKLLIELRASVAENRWSEIASRQFWIGSTGAGRLSAARVSSRLFGKCRIICARHWIR